MTLDIALSQPNQISSLRNNQPEQLKAVLNTSIVLLAKSMNVSKTMDEWQISEIVESITTSDKYWILKPEEIILVFKMATRGEFGEDYNRLDLRTVCGWLNKYIETVRTPYWEEYNRNIARKQEKSAEEMAEFFKTYYSQATESAKALRGETDAQIQERIERAKRIYYQQRFLESRKRPGFDLAKFDEKVRKEIDFLIND